MQTTSSLKNGDTVKVRAGRCKGQVAKITRVDRKNHKVYLENVHLVKRAQKPTQKNPQGGIIEKAAPLHWSKVMLMCGKCDKAVRIRHQTNKEGVKQRTCAKCATVIGN